MKAAVIPWHVFVEALKNQDPGGSESSLRWGSFEDSGVGSALVSERTECLIWRSVKVIGKILKRSFVAWNSAEGGEL